MKKSKNTKAFNKQKRKQFSRMFYKNNKFMYVFTIFIIFATSIIVVGISCLLQITTDIALKGDSSKLFKLSAMTIGLICLLTFNWLFERSVRNKYIKKALIQYKSYIFSRITKKNISSFGRESTGRYISSLTNDINSIEEYYLQGTLTLTSQCMLFIMALLLMIWYNWIMTLVAVGLSLVSLSVSLAFGNKLVLAEKNVSKKNEKFVGVIKDLLSGFTVIKSFKAESKIEDIFIKENSELESLKCTRRRTDALINLCADSAGLLVQMGIILIGIYFVMTKFMTIGVLVAFVQLMGIMLRPIQLIPKLLANKKAANGLIDKIAEVVDYNTIKNDTVELKSIGKGIECNDLYFAYEKGNNILNNINIKFEKNKSYAIVGTSGSGKSTLLNLLLGSYNNYEGNLKIGDVELRNINPDSLYDFISIIQQNVFIFDSSIKDNITMFGEFPKEKIDSVIECSGLNKLIDEKGEDYICGENGVGLSGGEKQRISIARCLLRETPILIMDEATASLDRETSFMVEDAILSINELTRIIVTHKLDVNIMSRFDSIIVFSCGKIVEQGTFKELLDKKGYFSSLYNISLGDK